MLESSRERSTFERIDPWSGLGILVAGELALLILIIGAAWLKVWFNRSSSTAPYRLRLTESRAVSFGHHCSIKNLPAAGSARLQGEGRPVNRPLSSMPPATENAGIVPAS